MREKNIAKNNLTVFFHKEYMTTFLIIWCLVVLVLTGLSLNRAMESRSDELHILWEIVLGWAEFSVCCLQSEGMWPKYWFLLWRPVKRRFWTDGRYTKYWMSYIFISRFSYFFCLRIIPYLYWSTFSLWDSMWSQIFANSSVRYR